MNNLKELLLDLYDNLISDISVKCLIEYIVKWK